MQAQLSRSAAVAVDLTKGLVQCGMEHTPAAELKKQSLKNLARVRLCVAAHGLHEMITNKDIKQIS